jgi:hypothetical protein
MCRYRIDDNIDNKGRFKKNKVHIRESGESVRFVIKRFDRSIIKIVSSYGTYDSLNPKLYKIAI